VEILNILHAAANVTAQRAANNQSNPAFRCPTPKRAAAQVGEERFRKQLRLEDATSVSLASRVRQLDPPGEKKMGREGVVLRYLLEGAILQDPVLKAACDREDIVIKFNETLGGRRSTYNTTHKLDMKIRVVGRAQDRTWVYMNDVEFNQYFHRDQLAHDEKRHEELKRCNEKIEGESSSFHLSAINMDEYQDDDGSQVPGGQCERRRAANAGGDLDQGEALKEIADELLAERVEHLNGGPSTRKGCPCAGCREAKRRLRKVLHYFVGVGIRETKKSGLLHLQLQLNFKRIEKCYLFHPKEHAGIRIHDGAINGVAPHLPQELQEPPRQSPTTDSADEGVQVVQAGPVSEPPSEDRARAAGADLGAGGIEEMAARQSAGEERTGAGVSETATLEVAHKMFRDYAGAQVAEYIKDLARETLRRVEEEIMKGAEEALRHWRKAD